MVLDRRDTTLGTHNKRAVGVFSTRPEAEKALHTLNDSGFGMGQVSVIARDADSDRGIAGAEVKKQVGNKADEGASVGAVSGGALGGLTGLLVGLGTLAIPGVGPIMLAGAAATALATTAAGGAIGAATGGLLGGLAGLGIPEREAKAYHDRVDQGGYLVIVDGTEAEINRAESILNHGGIRDWAVYDIPSTEARIDSMPPAPVVAAPTMPRTAPATDDESIKLYQERLVVDKDREKTGEVAIGKHVETETAQVSVPIEKERVIIERTTPVNAGATVVSGVAFQEGEAIKMDVYEEVADIHKEAFVREEVSIRKEVTEEMVSVEETIRREEIDINTAGHPVVQTDKGLGDRR